MLEMLSSWYDEYNKFLDGEITKEEYDHWRYNYPKPEAERHRQATDEIRRNKN